MHFTCILGFREILMPGSAILGCIMSEFKDVLHKHPLRIMFGSSGEMRKANLHPCV